jgi:1-acyl-sn-glycerol-3-phosphate acyltransferase
MNLLRGATALMLVCVNTLILCIPLYLMGLFLVLPGRQTRAALRHRMDGIVDLWVGGNRLIFAAFKLTRIDVQLDDHHALSRDRWYLVISNHQSWSDILILQNALWRRIPALKFFTKQQLVWVPLIGLAMWFLGFPYVRRASREQIVRNPELLARDRDATIEACQGFREYPSSVLNFLEGTRFTSDKRDAQQGRFRHLLNPKLGGLSYVVAVLEDKIDKVLDVTIIYPAGTPSFWQLLQGRCREVKVLVECRDLPAGGELSAPGRDSDGIRERLVPWIEDLWREKDARLAPFRPGGGGSPTRGASTPAKHLETRSG